ncbi:major facilitator superfamily domain-containing protein [Aspergillus flavus]|uniref:Major facilitator superfamily domain-containing protein n=1 Tax=Aspergillus flavus TaxID=5059 RepID=A0A5N6GVN1_ASPFL|nr:major facilitator superfamily domain-containing protein [Aspergillus flavus]
MSMHVSKLVADGYIFPVNTWSPRTAGIRAIPKIRGNDTNPESSLIFPSIGSPLQWPQSKRVGHVVLVSVLTLVMNLSSTIFSPGARYFAEGYGIPNPSSCVARVAPISELYGRLMSYHVCNLIFFGFTIGCAKSTGTVMFLAFRFLAGCAGSAPLTIGGGIFADVIPKEQRGVAMGMFSLGPTLGPSLEPIIGGFVAQYKGWRWTFWVLLILVSIPQGGQSPALEQKRLTAQELPAHFLRALLIPIKLLIFHPAVLLTSLSVAYAFGLSFLLFTTFPSVFQKQYGFSLGISGLCYLGMGTGMLIGVATFSLTSDKLQHWHIGYFWYGWSADKVTHWIVPIIGTSLIGLDASAALLPLAGQPLYDKLGFGWGNSLHGFLAIVFIPIPWLFYRYGGQLREWSESRHGDLWTSKGKKP